MEFPREIQPDTDLLDLREPLNALLDHAKRNAKVTLGDGIERHGRAVGVAPTDPFWAKIVGGTNPYSWQEVVANGAGGFTPLVGGRSGTLNAYEVNRISFVYSLAKPSYQLLVPGFGGVDYRFAHTPYGSNPACPAMANTICVSAWSLAAYCALVNGATPPECTTPGSIPGALPGVPVTITRIDPVTFAETAYATATTAANGRVCVTVPETVPDPTAAPTVVPAGGGASGGTLGVATYVFEYSYANAWGETLPSPPSPEIQVGIPDAAQYPVLATSVNQQGGTTGGALQLGTYYAKPIYKDAAGNHNAPPAGSVAIYGGVPDPDPAGPPIISIDVGSSSLANGSYLVAYAWFNADGETNLSSTAGFTQSAGFVFTATVPALPPSATGVRIYLSGNGGASWGRYKTGTVTDYLLNTAVGASLANAGSNTTQGSIPRLTVSPLSARPNATAYDLYLGTAAGGAYHLYKSGLTGTTVDLNIAYDPTTAAPPTTNTSLKNIPRLAFTPGGDITRLYAIPADHLLPASCQFLTSTTSPKDFTGTLTAGCPVLQNSTGWGGFRVRVHPANCNMQVGGAELSGYCNTYEMSFGFCCWGHQLTVTDWDTGAALSPTITCVNFSACSDDVGDYGSSTPHGGFPETNSARTSEIVGFCYGGQPCSNQGSIAYYFCGALYGGITNPQATLCTLSLAGYWDRCIRVPAPCDVPAIVTAKSTQMYLKANWVEVTCCGVCNRVDGRVPSMIPRTLYLVCTGPEPVLGTIDPVPITVHFDDAIFAATGGYFWSSGCLPGHGYGFCPDYSGGAPICKHLSDGAFGTTPACTDAYGNDVSMHETGRIVFGGKVFYRSTKVMLSACGFANWSDQSVGGSTTHWGVTWRNYWNPGCPDYPLPDLPPICGYYPDGRLYRALPWWFCDLDCVCGTVPAGLRFVGPIYGTMERIAGGHLIPHNTVNCGPVSTSGTSPGDHGPVCPYPDFSFTVGETR